MIATLAKVRELLTPAERKSALALLGLMFVGMVLETLGVGFVIPVVAVLMQDDLAARYPAVSSVLAWFGNPSHEAMVVGAMLSLVGLYLFKGLFLAFLAWRQTRFTHEVQAQLSQRLFTAYLRQPYTFHLQRNSAQLLRNMTGEVDMYANSVMIPGITLITEALVLFGLCMLLLIVEPVGALIVVGVFSVATWAFHSLTRRRIARWGLARQHHEGMRMQHLQQGLGAVKDVKLLGRETEFLEQYRKHSMQSARVGQLHSTLQQLPRLWLELLAVGGLATLVLTMLAQGRSPQTVLPTLGLFAAAAFRLMPSANRVIGSAQLLRYGLPVIGALHAELQPTAPPPPREAGTAVPFRDSLELDKVTFTYVGAPAPALKELSLTLRRGESVGFIGASGAGKSTLADILLGLLTPDSGEVRMDGRDIQKNLRNWQDQVGYVPQSIFLTDDTLRRNVAFGLSNEQIDEAAVWRSIRAAQLDELVNSLPAGLNVMVGERGIRLSGGQRQRIGIARALYHDPAVLVLDEATSSLDTATEGGVMEAVRALRGEKTIIIVAHRLSTIEHCDKVFRIEDGRVIEEGATATVLGRGRPVRPARS